MQSLSGTREAEAKWGEMCAGSSDKLIQAVPTWNLANCNSSALYFTTF